MIKDRGVVILVDEVSERWLELMKAADLNVLGVHEIVTEKPNSVDKVLSRLENPEFRALLKKFEENGIRVEFELHALEWLLPRELFDTRPELFRIDKNGNRVRELNCCASNPDALAIISDRAHLLATKLQCSSHNYYLWMDDAYESACCCENCKKYNCSDQNMIIMGAVLEGLKRYDPEAKLAYLAYADSLDVPTVAPHKDMFLEFAPITRNHKTPITNPDEPNNKKYVDLLEGLLKIFDPNEAHILEYWIDNSLFSGYKKPPVLLPFAKDVMAQDVKYYHSLGINSITAFGCYLGDDYFELFGNPPINDYCNCFNT